MKNANSVHQNKPSVRGVSTGCVSVLIQESTKKEKVCKVSGCETCACKITKGKVEFSALLNFLFNSNM